MADAEALLEKFYEEEKPVFLPADLSARLLSAKTSDGVTDTYLAFLAEQHRMKLATLDSRISHPAAELIC
jgi:predicted nucleic acid-binding protein